MADKVSSLLSGCAPGRSNHRRSPDSAPVNKASPPSGSNRRSLFSLPVSNPTSWFSVKPADLARPILLPASDAGIPAAQACYFSPVILKRRKEIP